MREQTPIPSEEKKPRKKPDRPVCGAQRSRGRGVCQAVALYPNGRCRVHGGPSNSVSGANHYNYKDGKRSRLVKALPKRLTEAAQAVLDDPSRLEMTEHLGVLNAMLMDSIGRWEGDGRELWGEMQRGWERYRAARARGNVEKMQAAMETLEDLADRGYADYLARTESRAIIQDIRQVADTERKRLIDAQLMLSADQVYLFVAQVMEDVNAEVKDKETLGRLQARFAARLGAHRERTRAIAS